jgi:uncharacterized protein YoxC
VSPSIETNRNIQLNWGTFNVPTIGLLLTIGGMLWSASSTQERQDARLDAIEIARAARSGEINKMIEALQGRVAPVDNLAYRVTVLEQSVADVNRRVDRVGDSMQGVRDDISTLSTKFEVLAEQVRSVLPGKKAELDTVPREFTRRP